jgi:hypothetical protein
MAPFLPPPKSRPEFLYPKNIFKPPYHAVYSAPKGLFFSDRRGSRESRGERAAEGEEEGEEEEGGRGGRREGERGV